MIEVYENLPNYADLEQQRISDFQECLGELVVRTLVAEVDVDDYHSEDNAIKDFLSTEYQYESTFYAPPAIADAIGDRIVDFEPMVSRGGKASKHGVFFGFLILEDGYELPIAVKPHAMIENTYSSKREADASALRDYFTNVAAQECGFESLEPVGLILNSASHAYSTTLLDVDFTTLDSINMTRFYEKGYYNAGLADILLKSASNTGVLHSTGASFHGDKRRPNEGINTQGQFKHIDWQGGHLTKAPYRDIEERFGKSLKDLSSFVLSLLPPTSAKNPGSGIFEKLDGDWWPAYREIFFDQYIDVRLALASEGRRHRQRLKDTKSETYQLERTLRSQVDDLQRFHAT